MNSPAHQELQKTLDVVQKGFEEIIQNIPQHYNEECMNQYKKNVDKYAECMYQKSKNVEKQMKAFDFKMIFMGITFDQCIKTQNKDVCIKDAKTTVEGFVQAFQKNIK